MVSNKYNSDEGDTESYQSSSEANNLERSGSTYFDYALKTRHVVLSLNSAPLPSIFQFLSK